MFQLLRVTTGGAPDGEQPFTLCVFLVNHPFVVHPNGFNDIFVALVLRTQIRFWQTKGELRQGSGPLRDGEGAEMRRLRLAEGGRLIRRAECFVSSYTYEGDDGGCSGR
jgi:hypothetical protein